MIERVEKEMKRDAILHDTYMIDVLRRVSNGIGRRAKIKSGVLDEEAMKRILQELEDSTGFIPPESGWGVPKK